MENPTMSSDESIISMLKTIRKTQMIKFDYDMKKQTVWHLIDYLCPTDLSPTAKKQMISLKTNYSKKFDSETGLAIKSEGVLIEMVWNIFMNGIWWETHGSDSETYYQDQGESMRLMKSVSRRLKNAKEEMKALERENEKIMEENGLITQQELERELDEQKRKYEEKLDDRYREDRNAYKTLQRQLTDIKAERNHVASENNRIKIESDYLRKENEDLIRQIQQMQSCPNPHKS
jgi:hypothetical protein